MQLQYTIQLHSSNTYKIPIPIPIKHYMFCKPREEKNWLGFKK